MGRKMSPGVERQALEAVTRSNIFFDERFAAQNVMGIIRGLSPIDTVHYCESAWDIGIDMMEIPIQSPSAIASLRAAAAAAHLRNRDIGVGTVTTLEQVDEARRVGATFTVAPGFDTNIALASLNAGIAHLPGVATASEIQRSVAFGFKWLKVFPALQLSPAWIKAVLAPFPNVCLVATGGIDAYNAEEFLVAGA